MADTATKIPLASVTLSSASSDVTFASISQSYKDLFVVIHTGADAASDNLSVRLNGDGGTNYSTIELYKVNASAGAQKVTNTDKLRLQIANACDGSTVRNTYIVNFNSYSNSSTYKTALCRNGGNTGSYPGLALLLGTWRNANPITSLTFFYNSGNLLSGSTFNLYGIL